MSFVSGYPKAREAPAPRKRMTGSDTADNRLVSDMTSHNILTGLGSNHNTIGCESARHRPIGVTPHRLFTDAVRAFIDSCVRKLHAARSLQGYTRPFSVRMCGPACFQLGDADADT